MLRSHSGFNNTSVWYFGIAVKMAEANKLAAQYGDLLLTIVRTGTSWRVRVQEVDDPESALSSGIDYQTIERAKEGAVSVALELFGTGIPEQKLNWQPTNDSVSE